MQLTCKDGKTPILGSIGVFFGALANHSLTLVATSVSEGGTG